MNNETLLKTSALINAQVAAALITMESYKVANKMWEINHPNQNPLPFRPAAFLKIIEDLGIGYNQVTQQLQDCL